MLDKLLNELRDSPPETLTERRRALQVVILQFDGTEETVANPTAEDYLASVMEYLIRQRRYRLSAQSQRPARWAPCPECGSLEGMPGPDPDA